MNESSGTGGGKASDDVRRAFSALPFDKQVSTLIRIELDMLGDAVDTVASAVSKCADEIAKGFECAEQTSSAAPGAAGSAPTS
jgi:hypothetical protein